MDNIPFKGWRITRQIGHGSFGNVYEIERDFMGEVRKSAMKVVSIPNDTDTLDYLYGSGFDDESISKWCRQQLDGIISEYSLMEKLKGNTNIVSVEDVEVVEKEGGIGYDVFIRMELLTSLKRVIRNKSFGEKDIIKVGKDICRALTVCEKINLIHRDIKPENILVSDFGDYKLGDFGIARTMDHTSNASIAGTERYMAPEIMKHEKYGRDVDTYSLGVVLYWLLNKKTMPFLTVGTLPTTQDMEESQAKRMSGVPFPEPVSGSAELKRIVLKACSYDRKSRYDSAEDMLKDLEEAERQYEEAETQYEEAENQYDAEPPGPVSCSPEDEKTIGMFGASLPENAVYDSAPTTLEAPDYTKDAPDYKTDSADYTLTDKKMKPEPSAREIPAIQTDAHRLVREIERPQPDKKKKVVIAACAAIAALLITGGAFIISSQNSQEAINENEVITDASVDGSRVLMFDTGVPDVKNNRHAEDPDYTLFGISNMRKEVKEVQFVDSLYNAPESAWDVSDNQDGSVKSWIDSSGCLYIGAEGGVVANTDCSGLFAYMENLDMVSFNGHFDTGKTEDMSLLFYGCKSLKSVDFAGIDTSNVVTMEKMFTRCESLEDTDCSNFNMGKVTSVRSMFKDCKSIWNLDLSSWDTSNIREMQFMFDSCVNLSSLNLGGLNTSGVTDFERTFYHCENLKSLDISSFETSEAITMHGMFQGCYNLSTITINKNKFITSQVTDFVNMFKGCGKLEGLDVSGFDIERALSGNPEKSMSGIFSDCDPGKITGYDSWGVDTGILFHSIYED